MSIKNEAASGVYAMYAADIKATRGRVKSQVACIDRLVMDACAITGFATTIQASKDFDSRVKVIGGYMKSDELIYTALTSLFHKSMSKSRRELLILLSKIQDGVKVRTRFDEVEHEMNVVTYREVMREVRDAIMNNDELEHFKELYKQSRPLRAKGGAFKDINDKNFGINPIVPNAPFEPINKPNNAIDELREIVACVIIEELGYDSNQLVPENIPGFNYDALESVTAAAFANTVTDLEQLRAMCRNAIGAGAPRTAPKRNRAKQPEYEGADEFASRMRGSNVDLSGTIFGDNSPEEFPRYADQCLNNAQVPPENGEEWDGDDYDYSDESEHPVAVQQVPSSKGVRAFDPNAARVRQEQEDIAAAARETEEFSGAQLRDLLSDDIHVDSSLMDQEDIDELVEEILPKKSEGAVNNTFAAPVVEEEEVSTEDVDTDSDSSGDVFIPLTKEQIAELEKEAEYEKLFFEEARALNAAAKQQAQEEATGGCEEIEEVVEEVSEPVVEELIEEVTNNEEPELEDDSKRDDFNDIIIPIAYEEFDFASITDEAEREAIVELASSAYMACRKSAMSTASNNLHRKREELEVIGVESAGLNGYVTGLYGKSNHVEYTVKNIARYDCRDNIAINTCGLDSTMLLQRHTKTENELEMDYNYIFYSVLEFSIGELDRVVGNDSTDHLVASAMHLASYYQKLHLTNVYKAPFECEYHMDLQRRCLHFITDHTLTKRNIAVLHTIWAKVCDTLTVNCKFKYYDGKNKSLRRQFEASRNDCDNFEFVIPPEREDDDED